MKKLAFQLLSKYNKAKWSEIEDDLGLSVWLKKKTGREFNLSQVAKFRQYIESFTVEISFYVHGEVKQMLEIVDESVTPVKLEKLLNSGRAETSIEEGSKVILSKSGKVIAKVVNVENNCVFDEFFVED